MTTTTMMITMISFWWKSPRNSGRQRLIYSFHNLYFDQVTVSPPNWSIEDGLATDACHLLWSVGLYWTWGHFTPEQHKVLQRSSAAASWARALWAERGCCTQIRRAIGSLREQERARGSQREPERARESQSEHASTLFCCKTVKYISVLSQNVKMGQVQTRALVICFNLFLIKFNQFYFPM